MPQRSTLTPKECSIKAPAKCKTSIFIYLDGDLPSMKSKLLGSTYVCCII